METKKWIFFLHNFIEPNHYAIGECIREMISNGVQYTFVCKRILSNSISERFLDFPKIKLTDVPASESFWQKYDGVHVIYDGKPSLAICALAFVYDVPYVISFHGGYDTNEKIYHKDVSEKTIWLCNHASAVSVVCMKDKQTLIKLGVSAEKIRIVAPPINRSLIMQVADLPTDKYRISVVGRLIPKKGIEYAIKALKELPQEYSLDIIGDGELFDDLKRLSVELGVQKRIVWHGQLPLDETLRIVGGNLIFWHPSIIADDGNADGIPQIILYAMALKRFVVASDESHIGELLQSGVNGYICEARNALSLAETTLSNVYSCNEVCNNASAVVQNFCLDTQKSIYKNIYKIGGEL